MKKLLVTSAALVAIVGMALAGEKPSAEHVQWMKNLGAQNGAIRKGVDVDKNATAMIAEMKGVSKFWAGRMSNVAAKSSVDVTAGAEAVLKAAGNTPGIQAGLKIIGSGCKGCHDAHREKISDTESLIK